MNPLAWICVNVVAWTGGLFQDPSSGVASSVFPKFQPGFKAANAADAVTGVNTAVQELAVLVAAMLVDALVLDDVELVLVFVVDDVKLVLLFVVRVVATTLVGVELETPDAVPGMHWE